MKVLFGGNGGRRGRVIRDQCHEPEKKRERKKHTALPKRPFLLKSSKVRGTALGV